MRDISGFMEFFISLMVQGVVFMFSTLDSISFMGVSVLEYLLWILILSALIPIIFALVKSSSPSRDNHVERRSSDKGRSDIVDMS